VNSPDDLSSPQRAARRKLVRGVFAAPAVLTVCNASATAVSSSLRCINNQVNGVSTVKTVGVTTSLDAWLRVQLWSTGSGPSTLYYVSGADVHAYKRVSNTAYIGSTQWQQFNISTNTGAGTFLAGMPTGATRASQYASVRFDANGNITGVGTGAVGTAAMPGTCWTSFHTAP
jgi:hypothetical protein